MTAVNAQARYRLGMAAREIDPKTSLLHLKAALDLDPGRREYWLAYCEALASCGEIATAIVVAEGAKQRGLGSGAMDELTVRLLQTRSLSEAKNFYALALQNHRECQLVKAIALYRKTLSLKPDFAEAEVNLGTALQTQGAVEDAVDHFEQAIALKPDFAEAFFNLGNALTLLHRDSLPAYRAAIAARPDYAEAHYNLAAALELAGKSDAAIDAYRDALITRPDFAEAYANLGVLLAARGELDAAITAYDAALALRPDFAATHSNRGNALQAKGLLEAAYAAYARATELQPDLKEAHNHLGNVQRAEGRLEEAIKSYHRVIEIDPHFTDASYNLGFTLLENHRIGEAFSWLSHHAKLRYAAPQKTDSDPPYKRLHDEEQRTWLGPGKPDPTQALHLQGGARIDGPAINRQGDIAGAQMRWINSTPSMTVIDNFLSDRALTELRYFCWNSTIWRETYEKGYLGAFPEHGITCPLLAQIAEELGMTYSEIFRDYPLLQAWAFKYDSQLTGIPLHADFAAVNVNFWITPDEANLDPEHGGLVIWDVAAPLEWNFQKYNVNVAAGRDFLRRSGARPTTVPYRSNRAVIFDSGLFHETDLIHFREGYANRRINLTLLYGRRGY